MCHKSNMSWNQMYLKIKGVQNQTWLEIKYVFKSNVSQNLILSQNHKCPKSEVFNIGMYKIENVQNQKCSN